MHAFICKNFHFTPKKRKNKNKIKNHVDNKAASSILYPVNSPWINTLPKYLFRIQYMALMKLVIYFNFNIFFQ